MHRVVIRKALLDRKYLERKKKSFPVMAVFIEKYLEERYPKWYEYLSKSACPVCGTLIPTPRQLYFHLTYFTRCSQAVDEIVEEIIDEYSKFHEHTCKKQYINHRKQLIEWLEKHGLRKTVQLCREGA
jgi:hypothetical protein